jgi:hypothetical protein
MLEIGREYIIVDDTRLFSTPVKVGDKVILVGVNRNYNQDTVGLLYEIAIEGYTATWMVSTISLGEIFTEEYMV